jgi:hypothetical protein
VGYTAYTIESFLTSNQELHGNRTDASRQNLSMSGTVKVLLYFLSTLLGLEKCGHAEKSAQYRADPAASDLGV